MRGVSKARPRFLTVRARRDAAFSSSQVNNFDSVQYLSYVFNKFNAQDMTYDIGNYFTNSALITTLNNYLNYNNDDAVMSSVYLGTMVDTNNIHVLDEFGRQTNSTVPLYQLVAEDVEVKDD